MHEFNEDQLAKIEKYREQGIEPYPSASCDYNPEFLSNAKIVEMYSSTELEDSGFHILNGRIMFKNELGNAGFARVQADGDLFQIFISKKMIGVDKFKSIWKKLDIGDIIRCQGTLMRTRMGELTLKAHNIDILSKCIEGMPDKVTGITNPEILQRQRYLDLMTNSETVQRFKTRSNIIRRIRNFFIDRDFYEVETPVLQSIPGGANARPFSTHHNALDKSLYMRIAPELYLKRLIVGGMNRVFEIGKNFRNEGISQRHNPEFTMIEFYIAYQDYKYLIDSIGYLIRALARDIYGRENSKEIPYGDTTINFDDHRVVSYSQILNEVGVIDPWSPDSILDFLEEKLSTDRWFAEVDGKLGSLSELQQFVFDEFVEPNLIDPTFVTHYPTSMSPLARRNDKDPRVTDRFELFIGGYEVANGFNELNDPVEQAERFKQQVAKKSNGDDEAMYFDEDYIKALSYGMPPTAGAGIGIDRLVMLLTNSQSIRDVILFPTKR